MKKQFTVFLITITFLIFGVFVFANQVYAETEISGNITTNTVWISANSPYIVTNNITIDEGVKLTIDPGVMVKFDGLYRLSVRGSLVARGTESNFITFTSNKENYTSEDWDGIFLDKLSRDNIFDYTNIEHARFAVGFGPALITDQNNHALISNSFIINNTTGINDCRSNSEISYNTISNVDTQVDIAGSCNIHHNNIIGGSRGYLIFNSGSGIIKINYNNLSIINSLMRMVDNNSGTNVDATNNWWGVISKSVIDEHIADYEDNSVLGKVNYEPYALAKLKFDGTDTFSQPPTCTSWTYSGWSACQSNGIQNRTIISSSPNGCSGGNPILTQSCTYVAPTCISWVYSGWSSCSSSGQQTRSIISSSPSSCAGGNPALTQSCTYTPPIIPCTFFEYSNWSACPSSGTKTRSVISSSPSSCSGGNPVLTQSCIYVPPTCTSWTYSGWGTCANSQQTRTITSSRPTNCVGGNPVLHQNCDSTPLCTENNWTSILTPTNCPNNGQQTKEWTKVGECQGGISRPSEETADCNYQAPTCTSFTYGDWGICDRSGIRARSVLSSSPSNCIGGNPISTQNCNYDSSEISNKDSVAEIKNYLPASIKNQNTQKAEESQDNQLQNEPTQIRNNEQETNQEKNTTGSQVAEQRKSEVASAVQEILQVAERDSGVGQQIKIIAQTQTQNQEKLEASLQKVQNRSGFAKFFIGSDYGEINNAKKLLEQNREQIKQLNQVKNQLANQDDQQKLTEQAQLLEQSNQEIENSLNTSQKGFSLFGWLFRLFVK